SDSGHPGRCPAERSHYEGGGEPVSPALPTRRASAAMPRLGGFSWENTMATVAFVCVGLTGHVYPSLAGVRELVERGESVVYLVPEGYRAAVERTGATCAPFQTCLKPEGGPQRGNAFASGDPPALVAWECVAAMPDILRILKQVQPDLLVY